MFSGSIIGGTFMNSILNIVFGMALAALIGIFAVMKTKKCSFKNAFGISYDSVLNLFPVQEQTFYVKNDSLFMDEMKKIVSKYSELSLEYTLDENLKVDLPYYACQIICSESNKKVVEHLIKRAVNGSLQRMEMDCIPILEWDEYDGIPCIRIYYASTKTEQEILKEKIQNMKISKKHDPVIDDDLEQELKENGC